MRLTTNNSKSLIILVLAAMCLAGAAAVAYRPASAQVSCTRIVTNTNDSGAGSLRQAITDANAVGGADTICFNIAAADARHFYYADDGVTGRVSAASVTGTTAADDSTIAGIDPDWPHSWWSIQPASALPTIAGLVNIDGYTQPGAFQNTLADSIDAVLRIELNGAGAGPGTNGLDTGEGSNNSAIRGLVVNRFGNFGSADGVRLNGRTSAIVVEGNFIGTDVSGTLDLGNGRAGVVAGGGGNFTSNLHTIGGTTPAARNLISGNDYYGVQLSGNFNDSNVVQGNFIGTDRGGNRALGNGSVIGHAGIIMDTSRVSTIGGTTAATRNIISGNNGAGVALTGAVTDAIRNNVVQGNFIGVGADGVTPLGNSGDGVLLSNFFRNGSTRDNSIGGTAAGAGNIIAYNGGDGVSFEDPHAGSGNTILGNSIFSNGTSAQHLGIDLSDGGVTPNDAGDADGGANNQQNFPVLSSFSSSGGSTTINGTLNSLPNTTFRVEFFINNACEPSGHGEGQTFLGLQNVTTDASGNAGFNPSFPITVAGGQFFTATATRLDTSTTPATPTDTSEFSAHLAVSGPAILQFSTATYDADENMGTATVTVDRSGSMAGLVTVNYATSDGTATAGADYTAASGLLTFGPNETSKTFIVPILDDSMMENAETINLSLSNPSCGAQSGTQSAAALTIIDNDAPTPTPTPTPTPAVTVQFSSATYTVVESGGTATINVTRTGDTAVSVNFATSDGTATAGSDYASSSGTLNFASGETSKSFTVTIRGDTTKEPDETVNLTLSHPTGGATLGGPATVVLTINDDDTPALQFSAANFVANEGAHVSTVTVNRTGDPAIPVTVDYDTSDGTAGEQPDYTTALGILRFAAGETQKTFDVLLTDDGYAEGNESFSLVLSNPTGGATLGSPSTAFVLLSNDNETADSATNPIDEVQFFVRMHYHDFLNREPDPAGLVYWVGEITSCGADAGCIDFKRQTVSAAFFISIEFQGTGYFVHRLTRVSFNRLPRYREFLRDTQEIGRGIVVGQGDWAALLEARRRAFAEGWVQRAEFVMQYPNGMAAADYVNSLFMNSGVTPTVAERDAAIAAYGGGTTEGRAQALRSVAESNSVYNAQYNSAFVLMQYFGYLRRNPDDPPDGNFAGYDFWLNKLNEFTLPGEDVRDERVAISRVRRAEMVRSFLVSGEYRHRFGRR